jgi:hypothetical protein
LWKELAGDSASGGASEDSAGEGQAAGGDRRDQAEGDADAHPSLAGALAELVLLDLAVVVLDEHADGVDLMYSVAFPQSFSVFAAWSAASSVSKNARTN